MTKGNLFSNLWNDLVAIESTQELVQGKRERQYD